MKNTRQFIALLLTFALLFVVLPGISADSAAAPFALTVSNFDVSNSVYAVVGKGGGNFELNLPVGVQVTVRLKAIAYGYSALFDITGDYQYVVIPDYAGTLSITVENTTDKSKTFSTLRITRGTAGTVNLASGINIHTGTATSSALVVGSSTAITSASNTQTMTIPTGYAATTTFYAHINLASGVTLHSATFGGAAVNYQSGNIVAFSLPAATSRGDLVLTFSGGHTATITVTRAGATSTSTTLNSVEIKSGATILTSTSTQFPTSAANAYGFTVPNEYSSVTVSVNPTASSGVSVTCYNSHNSGTATNMFTLSVGTPQQFRLVVTSGGTSATYYYTVTRAASAGTVTLANSVTIYNDSGATVATHSAAITSNSTQSITIPASFAGASSFYATIFLTSGVTLNSATFGAGSATVNGNLVMFSLPTTTSSQNLVLNFSGGHTATIIITREAATGAVTLASGITIVDGTGNPVASPTAAITSASGTQTVTIPAIHVNTIIFGAFVPLATGVSLSSATFGGSATTLLAHNIGGVNGFLVSPLNLPTTTSNQSLILNFAVGSTPYNKTIILARAGATNTLSALHISSAANTSNVNKFETNPAVFSPDTLSYTVYVENDTDKIYIYPAKSNISDTLFISGLFAGKNESNWNNISNSGYIEITLANDISSTVFIDVNNSSNNGSNRYILNIQRRSVVRNASLNSLIVSSSSSPDSGSRYTLAPIFRYDTRKYDVDLDRTISEVYLHFDTYFPGAIVSISSNAIKVSNGVYRVPLTTGQTKLVTINVTQGSDSTEYAINLNSGGSAIKARLLNIRVADSSNPYNFYDMAPYFDPTLRDYVVLLPYTSINREIYVQGTLNNTTDTLTIDGKAASGGAWVYVSSISPGSKKNIELRVADINNNTTTYRLEVIAAPNFPSSDSALRSLTLRSGSFGSADIIINPSFSPITLSYVAADVANSVDSVRVFAEGWLAAAIFVNNMPLRGSGDSVQVNLAEGINEIKVTVFAENCQAFARSAVHIYKMLRKREIVKSKALFLTVLQTLRAYP